MSDLSTIQPVNNFLRQVVILQVLSNQSVQIILLNQHTGSGVNPFLHLLFCQATGNLSNLLINQVKNFLLGIIVLSEVVIGDEVLEQILNLCLEVIVLQEVLEELLNLILSHVLVVRNVIVDDLINLVGNLLVAQLNILQHPVLNHLVNGCLLVFGKFFSAAATIAVLV